ncbi:MAG: transketolase family protein [Chloroflexi bacterium]|nr:transketolase family protein [Chloroflexota bacterium]
MSELRSTREAYGRAIVELGRRNPKIVVLDADLSESTQTVHFAKEFPQRFFNMGCAEQNLLGVAAGLSTCGLVPFVSTFTVFASMKACEQVRTSICYPNLNVKIVATHAGLDVGEAGPTHQSIEDIAIMRAFPNMTVISPADARETTYAVEAALEHKGPVYIRLGRSNVPDLPDEHHHFVLGQAVPLRPDGEVTLIATGVTVHMALEAADLLSARGIRAAVLNVHTIKPIDTQAILAAAHSSLALITVEDHNVIGGLGSAVLEALGETPSVPVKRLGLQDVFGDSGKPCDLFAKYGIDALSIAQAAETMLYCLTSIRRTTADRRS